VADDSGRALLGRELNDGPEGTVSVLVGKGFSVSGLALGFGLVASLAEVVSVAEVVAVAAFFLPLAADGSFGFLAGAALGVIGAGGNFGFVATLGIGAFLAAALRPRER